MNYNIVREDDLLVVKAESDLTIFHAQELVNTIKSMADDGIKYYCFDLSESKWIDSVGIGTILAAGKISLNFGKKAVIAGANEVIKNVVTKAKISEFVELRASVPKAMDYLGIE